ncbi:hypothetical protein [Roseobacter weihaiensis]|uniref:hypothetical protein n=1 Tax=Roseobacter weihaiensis TaxID=2763262 RepID=UPI001D0B760B|nr:hypothetical protein [Roseobacter sp. H9]
MIELATILAAIGATDTGLKTVKAGAETIKSIQGMLGRGSGEKDIDVTALRELVQDLRDENIGHREALQDAREKLLEIKRSAEEQDEIADRRAKYTFHTFPEGGVVLKILKDLKINETPEYICAECFETDKRFIPLQQRAAALCCQKCSGVFQNRTVRQPKVARGGSRGRSWMDR